MENFWNLFEPFWNLWEPKMAINWEYLPHCVQASMLITAQRNEGDNAHLTAKLLFTALLEHLARYGSLRNGPKSFEEEGRAFLSML